MLNSWQEIKIPSLGNENSDRKRKTVDTEEVEGLWNNGLQKWEKKMPELQDHCCAIKPRILRKKKMDKNDFMTIDGRNAKTFHLLSHMGNRDKQTTNLQNHGFIQSGNLLSPSILNLVCSMQMKLVFISGHYLNTRTCSIM